MCVAVLALLMWLVCEFARLQRANEQARAFEKERSDMAHRLDEVERRLSAQETWPAVQK